MPNTLTNLIPDVYAALDVVSRELTGFIPAVARDASADRIALNQKLRVPVTPANAAGGDITAAMTLPTAAYQTISNKTITLSKARYFPFSWTGEEQRAMDTGPGYLTIRQDQIAQAMRAAINEMETDIAEAAYLGSSRAYGTAGSTPAVNDYASVRKILDDNGAPATDRHVVIDTTAGVALRSTGSLQKVNESGDTGLLRQGLLGNLFNFDVRESAKVQTVIAGSMSNATTSNAALTVGQTVIPLAAAGTGIVTEGDIITIANDTNKYVVESASFAGSNPAAGDTITIAPPGLLKAQSAAARAITVVGNSARNIAFVRNAIVLATRLPEAPREGDLALFREVVTDPRTGISFEVAAYPGFRMVTYHISIVWGVKVIKPEFVATLLG